MVKKYQIILTAFLSVVVGVYLSPFLPFTQNTLVERTALPLHSPCQCNSQTNSDPQIETLKKQLAQCGHALDAPKPDAPKTMPTSTATASKRNSELPSIQLAAESQLATIKAENTIRWITENFSHSKDFNLDKEMLSIFDAEPIDIEWAADKEKKLSDLFNDKKELYGFSLKEMKCRTSQCQISVGVSDIEQANLVAEKMSALAATNDFSSVVAVPDQTNGVTTIYISNN